MTPEQRDELQDRYTYEVVDDMDFKALFQFAYYAMSKELDSWSTDDLITEVKEHYPHLLDDEIV